MDVTRIKPKHKRRNRSAKRGPRYWILTVGAMGALVAFTVGNSRAVRIGYAAERNGRVEITDTSTVDRKILKFAIAPGRLEEVLEAFKSITGLTVTVEKPDMLNVTSGGVTGEFTAEQALQIVLAGTGISYSFEGSKSVALVIHAESATVTISDRDVKVISSPKYTEPLRNIPQTITVIPREVIEQQGATTLRDVLNNVPGITVTAGEGGAPAGDNLTIRGFSARNDIYVDGVRDLGPQSRDPFNLEQVEIVKGPSSTFTGRGSTGGTINLISKLPNLRRSIAGSLTFGSDDTKRVTADINAPINDRIGFRLNLMGHDSHFPGRDEVRYRRWGVAPSLTYGLGTGTRVAVSYYYIEQDNISDYGIPWVPVTNNALVAYRDRPAPVPRDTFYGFRDRDKEHLRSDLVTVRLEHEFNDNISIRHQFRFGNSKRDSIATPPRFNSNATTVINREMRSWITDDDIVDNQTDFTARFQTGKIGHSFVGGASLTWENNVRSVRTAPNSLTTLLNPNPEDIYPGVITTNPLVPEVSGRTYAAYAFDTIKFNQKFEFVGGIRWDYFDVDGMSLNTTVTPNRLDPLARIDRIFSGRAALVLHPHENGTLYGSFGTSSNPSLEGLTYGVANTAIAPEKTYNYELGAKWEFLRRRVLLSSALFRVDKTNARTAGVSPGDPPQILDGRQRVDGVEFSLTGGLTKDWLIFAGYTNLRSEIVESNTLPTIVNGEPIYELGKELINTPRNSFNLWTTYTFKNFFFGGGPRYVGKRYGNNINTRFVDSYWLIDAMASYRVSKHFDLRVNLNNLSDKYYIDRIGGGHIIPGAARVITVSTGFSF
ncbi:MAG: TonB-dependent siderophore receptor [Pyrinomonadaceae bacterium]